MTHLINCIINRRVLFYIAVRLRDIGFGLVVVIVGDKILNSIFGKKLLEFTEKLRCQGFIGRDYQGWSLNLLNYICDCERFTGTGHTEQNLAFKAVFHAFYQLADGLGLISGRCKGGIKLKRNIHMLLPALKMI